MAEESGLTGAIAFALFESAAFAFAFVYVLQRVIGGGPDVPIHSAVVVLVFLGVQALIPLWVLLDMYRRPEPIDPQLIHVVVLPVLNVFGLAAYLSERNRASQAASSDSDTENAS